MIPVRLKLRNFLSYGESPQELDFTGFKLAVITGHNGSGKSSLIEAIIYALFGKGRVPPQELIHKGARRMEVEFTFRLEDKIYKVLRYQEKAQGIQLFMENNGEFVSISGRNIAETKNRLGHILGVNYDSFVNASFITQGNSATFSKQKTPAERHKLLAEILGLEKFNELAALAKEKRKGALIKANLLSDEINRLSAELVNLGDLEKREQTINHKLELLRQKKEELAREKEDVESEIHKLKTELQALENAERELKLTGDKIRKIKEGIENEKKRVGELESLVAGEDAIKAKFERYEKLKGLLKIYSEKSKRTNELQVVLRELSASLERERMGIEGEIKRLEGILGEWEKELKSLEELVSCEDEIKRKYEEYQARKKELAEFETKRNEYNNLCREEQRIKAEYEREKAKLETLMGELINKKLAIESELAEQKKLETEREITEKNLAELAKLEKEKDEIKELGQLSSQRILAIEDELNRLRGAKDEITKKMAMLEKGELESCPLCGTPLSHERLDHIKKEYASQIEQLSREEKENETLIANLREKVEEYRRKYKDIATRISEFQGVKEKWGEINAKLANLERKKEELKSTLDGISKVTFEMQHGRYVVEYKREAQRIKERIISLGYNDEVYNVLKGEIEAGIKAEEMMHRLNEAKEKRIRILADIENLKTQLKSRRELLEREDYGVDIRERIVEVQEEIRALGYDQKAHNEVEEEFAALEDVPGLFEKLNNAKRELPERKLRIDTLQEELAQELTKERELEERLAIKDSTEENLKLYLEKKNDISGTLKIYEIDLAEAIAEQGKILSQIEGLREKEKELEIKREELVRLQRSERLYGILEHTCGREGIQSFIINSVLPEIESEANRLLEILTGGEIKVDLRIEKEKGSEKLEIRLRTPKGIRDYDSFSGGEAFRIDFALRIGLSSLLASRSGKPLKTLVVDEGFGTQDEEGIQAFIDCINTIEPEFEKILVVSHLDTLKEAFPTRIEVWHDPVQGSMFRLVG